jgi:chemotaxis protein CheZ
MEVAVDLILTIAQNVMMNENAEAVSGQAADAYSTILEACAFQDITGQRLTKVIRTIEQAGAAEDACADGRVSTRTNMPSDKMNGSGDEKGLLNGPALPGGGLDQEAVNNLLAEGAGD